MTVALITDQHLDGRKGNIIFWEYFSKFYDEVFFPTLEKEGIKTIIDLGDTFDNRKGIDFNVWSRIRRHYFDRIHKLGITLHRSRETMMYTTKIPTILTLQNYCCLTTITLLFTPNQPQ